MEHLSDAIKYLADAVVVAARQSRGIVEAWPPAPTEASADERATKLARVVEAAREVRAHDGAHGVPSKYLMALYKAIDAL